MTVAPDHRSPRYQALIQLLRTAETLWNASRTFFVRWELSPSQFNVMNLLWEAPDGVSQSDLSRQLLMHRSNVTGLADRLERRKLVKRLAGRGDRRAYRVVLTPAGRTLMRQILPHYYAAAELVWGELSAERIRQLIEELQVVCANAERAATTPSS